MYIRREWFYIQKTKKKLFRTIGMWVVLLIFVLAAQAHYTKAIKDENKRTESKIEAQCVKEQKVVEEKESIEEEPEPEETFYREDIPLSYDLQSCLYETANDYGLEYELVLAVIKKETQFNNIYGDDGESCGYMQIQEKWHKARMKRLGVTDLNDPKQNFLVGCDFLSELLKKYDNLEDVLTRYNSGHTGKSTHASVVIKYMNEFLETKN